MHIVHTDTVFEFSGDLKFESKSRNPFLKLLGEIENINLAAEMEHYVVDSLEYLFPIESLELHAPSNAIVSRDPRNQDDKLDFRKQNVHDFRLAESVAIRGMLNTSHGLCPFLKFSYRGGPETRLARALGASLKEKIFLNLCVNDERPAELIVPYDEGTNNYDLEIWGLESTPSQLRPLVGNKARCSLDKGRIVLRSDIAKGNPEVFRRDNLENKEVVSLDVKSICHPLIPLHLKISWSDFNRTVKDPSQDSFTYVFVMRHRGWDRFLKVGIADIVHGYGGLLEYRNLFSNYVGTTRNELGRKLEAWNIDAYGNKPPTCSEESFFAVDYIDLHRLKGHAGIGLHRHRDNQEAYIVLSGHALMVVGDWCKMPYRERSFEIRTLKAGDMVVISGGNLHGLVNVADEEMALYILGGYD